MTQDVDMQLILDPHDICPDSPIGVFDSGVGGVSVLRDMVRLLPRERFIYYGDNKNAPYGTRSEEEIRALAMNVTSELLKYGIKALVVACNTATSAAIVQLREKLSIPVVGMEPALKPASKLWHGGQVLVLATPATLRQNKFQHLYELYGQNAVIQPCAGLMEFAERGEMEGESIDAYLAECLETYRGTQIDSAVLGCTHYVFLKKAIAKALPGVPLIDGNDGTARRLEFLLNERSLLRQTGEGSVMFMTSGEESVYLPRMEMLFHTPI